MASSQFRSGRIQAEQGLSLHWEAHGTGPALICCNGVGVSTFFWKYVVEEFKDRFTVVLWDYRGHGDSDRPSDPSQYDLSIRASAEDLVAVLDGAEIEKAVALGHSMGCQVALEAAIVAPDRIAGLVLMQGSAGKVLDTFFDNPNSKHVHKVLLRASKYVGPRLSRLHQAFLRQKILLDLTIRLGLVDPYYTKRDDFKPYLEHMATLNLHLFFQMVQEAHEHNAFPHLPNIEQPALIVAAEKDTFTPMWLSQRIARELPNASIIVLADATHAAIIEQPATINARLNRFLKQCY